MTGRSAFALASPLLKALSFLLRLAPRPLVAAMWWPVQGIPGMVGAGLRYTIAKRLAASCGQVVNFAPGCVVRGWQGLKIGSNVNFQHLCFVDASGGIEIGDNVSIAHHSSLVSFEHTWDDVETPIKYCPLALWPITIASDVWIGCGVRILGGSQIGPRTIVAAGAVITRGAYDGAIYAGVPAKPIKKLLEATET